jgi:hypothetical protein
MRKQRFATSKKDHTPDPEHPGLGLCGCKLSTRKNLDPCKRCEAIVTEGKAVIVDSPTINPTGEG